MIQLKSIFQDFKRHTDKQDVLPSVTLLPIRFIRRVSLGVLSKEGLKPLEVELLGQPKTDPAATPESWASQRVGEHEVPCGPTPWGYIPEQEIYSDHNCYKTHPAPQKPGQGLFRLPRWRQRCVGWQPACDPLGFSPLLNRVLVVGGYSEGVRHNGGIFNE